MRLRSSRNLWRVALTLLVASSAVFCGGGGGKRGGLDASCISFTTVNAAAPATVVGAQTAASRCETLQVALRLTDVDDVFTASFTVMFDGAMATYQGTSLVGSLLTSGGTQVEVFESTAPGEVTIGLTRLGVTDGVDFQGTGTLVVVIFQKRPSAADGTGMFEFVNGMLFGSETPPVEKAGIQWLGGELRIE